MHRDRLEILRSHHRANAGAPRRAMQIVDDARETHAALAGDTDGGNLQLRILVARLDPLLGVPHRGSPELVGGQDLDAIVDDVQVDGLGRPALDDQQIVARELELGAELAARIRAGDGVGERSLGDHRVTAAGGCHGARQRTRGEYEDVLRTHGVRLRIHALHEVLRCESAFAEIGIRPFHVERLD